MVATNVNSSAAPARPRNFRRVKRKCCFIWAKSISTFLRKRREDWKASVFCEAITACRPASSKGTDRARFGPCVHCGRIGHILQSLPVARYTCMLSF